MSTARQILANRRNGALGRGPKTSEGKARSKLNAVRHGLAAARTPLVPNDVEKFALALLTTSDARSESGEVLTDEAINAAEAQLALIKVRQLRADILDRIKGIDPAEATKQQAMRAAASDLGRLDRYERRALSKRSKAFCALTGGNGRS